MKILFYWEMKFTKRLYFLIVSILAVFQQHPSKNLYSLKNQKFFFRDKKIVLQCMPKFKPDFIISYLFYLYFVL